MVIDTSLKFSGSTSFLLAYRMIYHTSSWFEHLKSQQVYGMLTFSEFVNFVEDYLGKYKFLQKPHLLRVPSRPGGCITGDSSHLYQVNDKTVPTGESQVMNDRDWEYV